MVNYIRTSLNLLAMASNLHPILGFVQRYRDEHQDLHPPPCAEIEKEGSVGCHDVPSVMSVVEDPKLGELVSSQLPSEISSLLRYERGSWPYF